MGEFYEEVSNKIKEDIYLRLRDLVNGRIMTWIDGDGSLVIKVVTRLGDYEDEYTKPYDYIVDIYVKYGNECIYNVVNDYINSHKRHVRKIFYK